MRIPGSTKKSIRECRHESRKRKCRDNRMGLMDHILWNTFGNIYSIHGKPFKGGVRPPLN